MSSSIASKTLENCLMNNLIKSALLIALLISLVGCFSNPLKEKWYDKDGNELTNKEIIDDAREQVSSDHGSSGITTGQSWFFYVMCGICILCAIGSFKSGDMVGVGGGAGGALVMAVMPSMIEAVNEALQGLVVFFYGALIICFLALIAWVGFKIYKYVPKIKEEELKTE